MTPLSRKPRASEQPSVVLYKDFDEGKNVFKEKFDVDVNLPVFAQTASTPLVGEVGPETYAGYMAVSFRRLPRPDPVMLLKMNIQGRHSSCLHLRRNTRGAHKARRRAQVSR